MICAGCGREDILCPTCTGVPSPLEQKIKDRIKELETMWFTGTNVMKDIEYRDVKLDELRKLLE